MKYRKGIYLEYNTIFGWKNWYGKFLHIWKILLNKPLKVIVDIKKADSKTIEKFYRQ